MVYDTLYAHQDKEDDAKLGIYSTAMAFAGDTKPILHVFALGTYGAWLAAAYHGDALTGVVPWMGLTSAYGHLIWQIETAQLDGDQEARARNLGARFRSNHTVGAIVFGSIVAGKLLS
mmetsp:Transcript_8903/g.20593  ORF Transcript_8903/g.20593 Transcript_8903/m.20593 type:complete len:118 (-) Transcript_8903:65-418(-)